MQFDPEIDLYAVLQVSDTASGVIIRAAHEILAQQYEGDWTKRNLVNEAYNVLSHPTQRERYDAFREAIKGRKQAREAVAEVAVLCPVCQSRNVMDPQKDNRAAICGICRAKLSKDLIGKPIRNQARKNILAMIKRRYASMPRAYRESLVIGVGLLLLAGLGTASFFGWRASLDTRSMRFELSNIDKLGRPVSVPAAPLAAPRPPETPQLPVAAGARTAEALGSLAHAGWAITSQYDVTAQKGPEHVVECRRGAVNARLYFRKGRLAEAESF